MKTLLVGICRKESSFQGFVGGAKWISQPSTIHGVLSAVHQSCSPKRCAESSRLQGLPPARVGNWAAAGRPEMRPGRSGALPWSKLGFNRAGHSPVSKDPQPILRIQNHDHRPYMAHLGLCSLFLLVSGHLLFWDGFRETPRRKPPFCGVTLF